MSDEGDLEAGLDENDLDLGAADFWFIGAPVLIFFAMSGYGFYLFAPTAWDVISAIFGVIAHYPLKVVGGVFGIVSIPYVVGYVVFKLFVWASGGDSDD